MGDGRSSDSRAEVVWYNPPGRWHAVKNTLLVFGTVLEEPERVGLQHDDVICGPPLK